MRIIKNIYTALVMIIFLPIFIILSWTLKLFSLIPAILLLWTGDSYDIFGLKIKIKSKVKTTDTNSYDRFETLDERIRRMKGDKDE